MCVLVFMVRFDINRVDKSYRIAIIGEFYDAISCLKNRADTKIFFRDLLMPNEIAMLHRRIQVAIMLNEKHTFDEIIQKLGVGSTTIRNVKKSLERHGEGYDLIIKRFQKLQDKKDEKRVEAHKRKIIQAPNIRRYAGGGLLADMLNELKIKKK